MARRVIKEDRISHERWMVSYADFLTLLLAFFVVMYSVSQLNEDKYRVLSNTLTAAFNLPERSLQPIQVGERVTAVMPGVVDDAVESPEQKRGAAEVQSGEAGAVTLEPQLPEEFRRIARRVEDQFAELVQQELVTVQGNEEWLEIELQSSLLFASGDAELNENADPIIAQLADAVRDSELPIRVEGFSDDRPIANALYPSNWELSSARAASVVKMLSRDGVDPKRLAAVGYAEFQPVAPNDTEAGRAANRRVSLMISRTARLRPELAAPAPEEAPPPEGVPDGAPVADQEPEGGVMRIELEDGGLLFTNDPSRAAARGDEGDAPAPAASEASPVP
jgi:chemotaxis protein MotB